MTSYSNVRQRVALMAEARLLSFADGPSRRARVQDSLNNAVQDASAKQEVSKLSTDEQANLRAFRRMDRTRQNFDEAKDVLLRVLQPEFKALRLQGMPRLQAIETIEKRLADAGFGNVAVNLKPDTDEIDLQFLPENPRFREFEPDDLRFANQPRRWAELQRQMVNVLPPQAQQLIKDMYKVKFPDPSFECGQFQQAFAQFLALSKAGKLYATSSALGKRVPADLITQEDLRNLQREISAIVSCEVYFGRDKDFEGFLQSCLETWIAEGAQKPKRPDQHPRRPLPGVLPNFVEPPKPDKPNEQQLADGKRLVEETAERELGTSWRNTYKVTPSPTDPTRFFVTTLNGRRRIAEYTVTLSRSFSSSSARLIATLVALDEEEDEGEIPNVPQRPTMTADQAWSPSLNKRIADWKEEKEWLSLQTKMVNRLPTSGRNLLGEVYEQKFPEPMQERVQFHKLLESLLKLSETGKRYAVASALREELPRAMMNKADAPQLATEIADSTIGRFVAGFQRTEFRPFLNACLLGWRREAQAPLPASDASKEARAASGVSLDFSTESGMLADLPEEFSPNRVSEGRRVMEEMLERQFGKDWKSDYKIIQNKDDPSRFTIVTVGPERTVADYTLRPGDDGTFQIEKDRFWNKLIEWTVGERKPVPKKKP